MKRLLSHQAIFDMNQAFKRAIGEKLFTGRISSTFRYAMHRNIEITDKEVNSMLDAFKPDDEYIAYTRELGEIAKRFSLPPISNIREFDHAVKQLPPEQNAEFTKLQTDLADKYKEAIERQRDNDAELGTFMNEKVEIDISMVPAEQCPEIVGDSAIYIYDSLFPMFIPAQESDTLSEIVPYECV
jgi:hypothetical protein